MGSQRTEPGAGVSSGIELSPGGRTGVGAAGSRRALISVSDKTGLDRLGRALAEMGCAIFATGSTAQSLSAAGFPASTVDALTGFPEILGGRVKTLHPAVFAGILARPTLPADASDLVRHGLAPFDVVVCNLYPFAAAVAAQATFAELIEKVDVGGVTLLRAAAKNHEHVIVLCDPADYEPTLTAWARGELTAAMRLGLALKAFRATASYDALIAEALCARASCPVVPAGSSAVATSGAAAPSRKGGSNPCSGQRFLSLEKVADLRYGENPHQKAALFRTVSGPAVGGTRPGASFDLTRLTQIGGKELSYNNYLDCEHALRLASELPATSCVIVKHNMPCGVGVVRHETGSSAASLEAFEAAFAADPVSPFGGVVVFGSAVCGRTATRLSEIFLEIVAAPAFTPEALSILGQKKNLRLLVLDPRGARLDSEIWTQIQGGFLIQDADVSSVSIGALAPLGSLQATSSGGGPPSGLAHEDERALQLALAVVKHVRSNAIVFATANRTLAIAGGFTNRVDAVRRCIDLYRAHVASWQAGEVPAEGRPAVSGELPFVVASDGFFPFADSIDALEGLPVRAIAQPGGSVRDAEVLARAASLGIPMVMTGARHFKH